MEKILFGKLDTGEPIYLYKITNGIIYADIITRGATIKSFGLCEDGVNVVGSFDTLEEYIEDTSFQGTTVGRVANRIKDGKLTLGNKVYQLPQNNGKNCLHGGDGFNRMVWNVESYSTDAITLSYYSPDGEKGFPGGLQVYVSYTLSDSALVIDYKAIPEDTTVIALTNHSYFNLDGFKGTIYNHTMQVFANEYTAVYSSLIPTGEHPSVEGTFFDLREPKLFGDIIGKGFNGFDHNFVLAPTLFRNFNDKKLGLIAVVKSPERELYTYTNMPGVQIYTSNSKPTKPNFSGDVPKIKHGAFCLETQTEPNSVNHGVGVYSPGEVYTHTTVYLLKKAER